MLFAIWFGLLYNNKRLDDFKDLMRAEIGRSEEKLRAEILRSEEKLRLEIGRSEEKLRAEIARSHSELSAEVNRLTADSADINHVLQVIERMDQRLERLAAVHHRQRFPEVLPHSAGEIDARAVAELAGVDELAVDADAVDRSMNPV